MIVEELAQRLPQVGCGIELQMSIFTVRAEPVSSEAVWRLSIAAVMIIDLICDRPSYPLRQRWTESTDDITNVHMLHGQER